MRSELSLDLERDPLRVEHTGNFGSTHLPRPTHPHLSRAHRALEELLQSLQAQPSPV